MEENRKYKSRVDDIFEKIEKSVSKEDKFGTEKQAKPVKKEVYKSINFILLDGNQHAFNYSYLVDTEFYNNDECKNVITLNFSSQKVIVSGYALLPLYHDFVHHHVNTVYQDDDRYQMNDTDHYEPFIVQIDFE